MQTQNIQSSAAGGKCSVTDSSAMAYESFSNKDKQKQQNEILSICAREQNRGARDLTAKEISIFMEEDRSREAGRFVRVNPSDISNSVNKLIAAGRLIRTAEKRTCSASTHPAYGLFMPMAQTRLVA